MPKDQCVALNVALWRLFKVLQQDSEQQQQLQQQQQQQRAAYISMHLAYISKEHAQA